MILGAESVTLLRRAAGGYTAGEWVPGAETSSSLLASVQPASPFDLEVLDIGDRSRRAVRLYTSTELRLADPAAGTAPDAVEIDGVRFVVRAVDRLRDVLPHYRAIAVVALEEEVSA